MIADRPTILADDPATVSRLGAFKETCQRFIATLERCDPANAETVSFTDLYAPGPRFQRRFTTGCDHGHRTIDVYVEQEEIGGRLEVAFYLSPRPGQPSYRIVQTQFADGSNRPDHEGSPDDLKAILERFCRLADDRLAGPITNAIRARDLPQHLTALIRSRLGSDAFARLAMLHLSEEENYGQLDAEYADWQMRRSPIFSPDFVAHLQAAIPLEMGLGRQTLQVPHRHPDIGLPETDEFTLFITAKSGLPWVNIEETASRLGVIEEMNILALWPEFGSDFVLPHTRV